MVKITRHKWLMRALASMVVTSLVMSTLLLVPFGAGAMTASLARTGAGSLGADQYLLGEWVTLTGSVMLGDAEVQTLDSVVLQIDGPNPVDDIGDIDLPTEEGVHTLQNGRLVVTVTHNNVSAVGAGYGYGYGYAYDFTGGTGGGSIDYVIQWRAPYLLQNPDAELPDADLAWEIPDAAGLSANKLPLGMTSDGTYLYILVDGAQGGMDRVLKTNFNGGLIEAYDAPSSDCQSIAYVDGSLYVYADNYQRIYTVTDDSVSGDEWNQDYYRLDSWTQNDNQLVQGTLVVNSSAGQVTTSNWDNWSGSFRVDVDPAWDDNSVSGPSVVDVGGTYYMYYHSDGGIGTDPKIGLATSTDGVNWTKDSNNPILEGTALEWDAGGTSDPSVIYDGSSYHMWYIGSAGLGSAGSIGYATSADGVSWTKDVANPVHAGTSGQWDGGGIQDVTVVDTSSFTMYYTAIGEFDFDPKIGYAYNASGDGTTWVGLSKTTEEYLALGENPSWSPDGTRLAHIYSDNLWIYDTGTTVETDLTTGWSFSETQVNRSEEHNNPPFNFYSDWGWWDDNNNQYPGASEGWFRKTNNGGQFGNGTVTISFTGTEATLGYFSAADGGLWDVELDTGAETQIDAYSASRAQKTSSYTGLSNTAHTLVLTQVNTAGGGGGYDIAIDYLDVSTPMTYPGPSVESDPVYHPTDDDVIAFVSDITGDSQIFEVDISAGVGSPVFNRVTTDTYDSYEPTYNGDGTLIAYSAKRDRSMKVIWTIGPATAGDWGAPRNVSEDWWNSAHTAPAWNPTGDYIALVSGGDIGYVEVDEDGLMASSWLNSNGSWIVEDSTNGHPAWSADGTQLAFNRGGSDKEIWMLDWDENDIGNVRNTARQLADAAGSTDYQPTWSPDGAWVYYASDANATGVFDIWRTEDAPENPVMSGNTTWDFDENGVSGPSVTYDGSTYRMWYTGENNNNNKRIGYATSSDGKSWDYPASNPVINNEWNQNNNWEDQDVYAPAVVQGTGFNMWYVGENSNDNDLRIGKAISGNGAAWSKDPNNPVFEGGTLLGTLTASYQYTLQNDWQQNSIIQIDPSDSGAYVDHWNSPNGQNMGGLGSDGTFLYGRPSNDSQIFRVPPSNMNGWDQMWIGGAHQHFSGGSALVVSSADSMYYANGGTIYKLEPEQQNPNNLNEVEDYNTGLTNINGLAMIQDTMYIAASSNTNGPVPTQEVGGVGAPTSVGQVYMTGVPGTVKLDTTGDYTSQLVVNSGAASSTEQAFTLNELADPVDVAITTPADGSAYYTPTIDIEGTVNDPSIDTVQVGIDLPMILFLEDDMEDGDSETGTGEFSKREGAQKGWMPYQSSTNLWHLSDERSASGNYSWSYSNENSFGYNTPGFANSGRIVSTPFDIGEETVFSFETSWDTDGWVEVDRKLIDIKINGEWQPLAYIVDGPWFHDPYNGNRIPLYIPMAWNWDDGNKFPTGGASFGGPQWTWTYVEIDFADYGIENVDDAQIRFSFDTMDDFLNDMDGWYVDDVMVSGSGFLGFDVDVDPDTLTWETTYQLAEGINTISVEAQSSYITGDDGEDEESVTVSLDTTVPIVELDSYPSTNEGLVTITGSVNELNFDRMVIKRNGALISTIDTLPEGAVAPMWDFEVDVPLVDGDNEIIATIWDVPNATADPAPGSDTINVIRDAGAPTFEVLDTVYYLGEVSARRGDLFVFQVNVTDQGTIPSGVRDVEIRFPGGGEDSWGSMIPAYQLPEAFRDAWGTTGQYLMPMIIPEDAAPGNYEMEIRATDWAGNTGNSDENCLGVVVSTLSAYNIYLMPEWNFFSLPLIPDTASIDTLMGDIDGLLSVQYYDAASQTWQVYTPDGNPLNDTLTILGTGKGYWAEMDESVYEYSDPFGEGLPPTPAPIKFSYAGEVLEPGTVPPTYNVYEGWNAVGIHSEWSKPVETYLRPVSVPQQTWAALLQYDNYISVDISEMFQGEPGDDPQQDEGSPYEIFLGSFRTLLETGDMNPAAGFWLYLTQAGKLVAMP